MQRLESARRLQPCTGVVVRVHLISTVRDQRVPNLILVFCRSPSSNHDFGLGRNASKPLAEITAFDQPIRRKRTDADKPGLLLYSDRHHF